MNVESSYCCLMKQDSLPRRPRRANSPERCCTTSGTFKAVRRVSYADSVSDLSLSSSQGESGCESVCSFSSFDDLSTILNHSAATTPSSSSHSSSPSRKFSTVSCLSLFSSQPQEKKKKKKSARGGRKPQKEITITNRWDSWNNEEPQGSPVKPERKALVDSRWSSHSSRAPIASPRRSSSPKRISCAPALASVPLMFSSEKEEEEDQQDIVFHPQSSSTRRLPGLAPQPHHRAVLTRRPKARNLVLEAAIVPNRYPRTMNKTILTERDHETIRKLKSTWESRRSVVTTSTRDSGASSTASPDYSIPWFSSSLQQQHRPSALK